MIQIDIPMPKRCLDCPCYGHAVYGKCKAKEYFFSAEDRIWQEKRRPDWCPLLEERKPGKEGY